MTPSPPSLAVVGQTGAVDGARIDERALRTHATEVLRAHGAPFAFVFGSRAGGAARPDSDLDVAAWWPVAPPLASDVLFDGPIDLLVLNEAPLELAGRVALHGELLFDDDAPSRVHWVADTRKVYLDEVPRMRRYEQDLLDSLADGR